ncbi:acyl-CoA dehydrogenase [Sphingomonas sp. ST-64]|uniref:Acyl-CoA dehydrogenase n=1 Tax=Sphingomonas plantiphila TaxID=3163295 RepID=A0ABW8YPA7_9SPHN
MAFEYHPVTGGELFEVAARFAEDADARAGSARRGSDWQADLEQVWDSAVALGWPLSLIPEALGGVGGSAIDTFALIEGAARYALPLPLVKSSLLLPHLLDDAALTRVADGELRPTVVLDAVYPWRAAWPDASTLSITDDRISGAVLGTECVPDSTHFLIALDGDVVLVPAEQVEQRVHQRIDGRLAMDLRFDAVPIAACYPGKDIDRAIDLAALAACVEIVAGAATVIEDTVGYLRERHQFGVPLSSFQVLRHHVADMYIAYQNAHALTAATLRAIEDDPGRLPAREIARTKLRVGEVGRFVAETSIQLHGGMGMTEENRPTRIGKRLILADLEWGDRAWQAERLLAAEEDEA